jgi:dTDP-4-dehydrorhamnose 3,5-epimerase-like enzyme
MAGVRILNFNKIGNRDGSLIPLEGCGNIPFNIKRVYYIFDTKKNVERGFHAHKDLKQLCIAVKGSCTFIIDDGLKKEEIILDNPSQGLYIESLIWREMKDFSPDCVLVVLASEHYNESDYIRDYEIFKKEVEN